MQIFFGTYTKIMCASLVLLSLAVLQVPVEQSARDYNTFGNWIEQHLPDLDTKKQYPVRKAVLNSHLIENLSCQTSEEFTDEHPELPDKSDKNRIISYLYIGWAQHHSASDMAGTFGKDRVQIQQITKYPGFWITQFSPGTTNASNRFAPADAARIFSDTLLPSAYNFLAVIGGKSINAP